MSRWVKRNLFTILFNSVGKRKAKMLGYRRSKWAPERFKMQKIRRSHQGYRNRIYGSIQAIKMRLHYGRRKVIAQFRR